MAVLPPATLVDAMTAAMDRPARAGLRWSTPDQWHVTLRFFAAVDPDALVRSLDGARAGPDSAPWGPVVARAGPRPEVLGDRLWVLPVTGLEGLAAAIASATGHAPGGELPFRGHLTLARARRPEALRDLDRPAIDESWLVEQVVAFRSELGPDGARHHRLGRWGLGAR